MSASVTAQQFDLISDDPRRESHPGMFAEFAEFYRASRELRGLLTQAQAAKILGVQRGQIGSWITRGRLSSRFVADVRMVSAGEVLALYKERQEEIRKSGGRGVKAPSLSELAQAAWEDMDMDNI
jgi:hypothetical protein